MLLALLACFGPTETAHCATDDATITTSAGTLACTRAKIPTRYLRVLSGRPLPNGATATGIDAVVERYGSDPKGTDAWLDALEASARAIEQAPGLEGSELRAAAIYRETTSEGLLANKLGTLPASALSVRARDEDEKLALTEHDIETWILYASLCHEVQSSGVLRLSVAQKVDLYEMVRQRFEHGDRTEMVALAAFGPTWETVVDRWKAASYDQQQAWIRQAPLPPPMDASHLAYVEAVIEGDVVNAARSIHQSFGPLHFRDGPGYFSSQGSP